jgi:hypothetical protein
VSHRTEAVIGRRHRLIAALAVVMLGLLGALIPAVGASAAGGFTGRLVDQLDQPVVGVPVLISQRSDANGDPVSGVSQTVTTLGDGTFGASGLADGGYEAYVQEGTAGTGGERFSVVQELFTIADGEPDPDLGDVVTNRYVLSAGTIANWTEAMGDVRVDMYVLQGGVQWQQINIQPPATYTSTDGTFEVLAPIDAREFTLRFLIEDAESPFVDTYLGGGYNLDPELAAHLDGVPGVGFSGLSVTMPTGATVSGRVTGSGGPLAGIEVEADGPDYYDYGYTDALGNYTLYVYPGSDYAVYAYGDDSHAGEYYYTGGDPCGCAYDPVATSTAEPAEDIDFDLAYELATVDIEVIALNAEIEPLDQIRVRLYRASGDGWVLESTRTTDVDGDWPGVEFDDREQKAYRLQFANAAGRILSVVDGAVFFEDEDPAPLDPVPACYAELGQVGDDVFALAVLDEETATGACAALAAPTTVSPPGGSGTPSGPRQPPGVVPTATPTPTPTPTVSPTPATPSPSSTSPAPEATDPAVIDTASSPDLWWLLWVGIALLVLVVIGGIVIFIRRD